MKTHTSLIRSLVLSFIVIALAIFITWYVKKSVSNQSMQQEAPSEEAMSQNNNLTTLKNGFTETVLSNPAPVVVTFFADWCPSCNAMHPVVAEVAQELKDIQFVEVNVDEFAEVANTYGIQAIPTFIFFNKGTLVDRATGFMNKEQFVEVVKKQFGMGA
jgi:thioredoxin 1